MDLFKKQTNFDFIGKRIYALTCSLVLVIASIGSLVVKGVEFGIDFTGGMLIEIGYSQPVDLSGVRQQLAAGGFGDAAVQHFGTSTDVLVRLAPRADLSSADLSTDVMKALAIAPENMRRVEFVGPQVGDELKEDGGLAMLYALIGILIYVALRFEYRFAIGAVVALIHDVIIVLGMISVFGVLFDLTTLAAILAVIGYSLNDTIVVFDRIRENFRKMRKGTVTEIINASWNQTLSRTIMTSFTTLLVLIALYAFGGEVLRPFSFALIVGILVGTFSSIYVASWAALVMGVSKLDFMTVKKEGEGSDNRP